MRKNSSSLKEFAGNMFAIYCDILAKGFSHFGNFKASVSNLRVVIAFSHVLYETGYSGF